MSAARKLEYFAETIEREVDLRKRRAKHRLASEISQAHAKTVEAAAEKITARVEAARRDLKREANKKIAAATAEAKAKFFAKRKILKLQLLDEVLSELIAFARSEEYVKFLIKKILAAKADFPDETPVVKIGRNDTRAIFSIAQATGISPEISESDYIGGFIIESGDGKIRADYTFRTRLSETEKWLM